MFWNRESPVHCSAGFGSSVKRSFQEKPSETTKPMTVPGPGSYLAFPDFAFNDRSMPHRARTQPPAFSQSAERFLRYDTLPPGPG